MGTDRVINLSGFYDVEIPIDDGIYGEMTAAGATLPIRVRRFTIAELQEFQRGYSRLVKPPSQRSIFRRPDSEEQALKDDGRTFLLSDDEIERRRLHEMSPDQLAAYDAMVAAEDVEMVTFCQAAIEKNISLQPGVKLTFEESDGSSRTVRTGKDLVEVFGGNLSMLIHLTRTIHQENTLSADQKKFLRSLSDSTATSRQPKGAGETPAATATNAAQEATALNGAVSAALDPIQSGSIPPAG